MKAFVNGKRLLKEKLTIVLASLLICADCPKRMFFHQKELEETSVLTLTL